MRWVIMRFTEKVQRKRMAYRRIHTIYATDQTRGIELIVAGGDSALFDTHTHISTLNILMIRSGQVRLWLNSRKQVIEIGRPVIIHPHQAHRIQASDRFSMVTLSLNGSIFTEVPACPRAQIQRFLDAVARRGYLSSQEKKKFLHAVASTSFDRAAYEDPFSLLRQSIEENPEQSLSLDAMAKRVHMEKCHFIRSFKQRYGITPHAFVIQNRIRKARRMIIGNHSLTETALSAGFYDQSHFIRNFKRFHNLAPSEYRKAISLIE